MTVEQAIVLRTVRSKGLQVKLIKVLDIEKPFVEVEYVTITGDKKMRNGGATSTCIRHDKMSKSLPKCYLDGIPYNPAESRRYARAKAQTSTEPDDQNTRLRR